jgi:hypothetical protein
MTEHKSPIDQALDLFFYAPVGFLLNAPEVLDDLVQKGHQQVVAARLFGKFAVDAAPGQLAQLQKRVEKLAEQFTPKPPTKASPAVSNGHSKPAPQASVPLATAPVAGPRVPVAPIAPAVPVAPAAAHGPGAEALAITDYDSLSASQVVPRLAGLSSDELDAVKAYESAHRGRKTILNKIAQLQS